MAFPERCRTFGGAVPKFPRPIRQRERLNEAYLHVPPSNRAWRRVQTRWNFASGTARNLQSPCSDKSTRREKQSFPFSLQEDSKPPVTEIPQHPHSRFLATTEEDTDLRGRNIPLGRPITLLSLLLQLRSSCGSFCRDRCFPNKHRHRCPHLPTTTTTTTNNVDDRRTTDDIAPSHTHPIHSTWRNQQLAGITTR
jgi:hypothetical protein